MLKILSDPIINQIIGSSVQINRSLHFCFRIFCFLSVTTKSMQNNQNLKFSADTKSGKSILTLFCRSERFTIHLLYTLASCVVASIVCKQSLSYTALLKVIRRAYFISPAKFYRQCLRICILKITLKS